jgi:hypothetical protein
MVLWYNLPKLIERLEVVDFKVVGGEVVLELADKCLSHLAACALGHDLVVLRVLLES